MLVGIRKLMLSHLLEDLDALSIDFGLTLALRFVQRPVIPLAVLLAVEGDMTSGTLEELVFVVLVLAAPPASTQRLPLGVRAGSANC